MEHSLRPWDEENKQGTDDRKEARPENAIPEVHMDCFSMGRESDDVQPILVARDWDTRMNVNFLVQGIGMVRRPRDQETLAVLLGSGLPREQGRGPVRSGVARAGCGGEAHEGEERGADVSGALAREIVRVKWSRGARHQGGGVPGAHHAVGPRPGCEQRRWAQVEHTG